MDQSTLFTCQGHRCGTHARAALITPNWWVGDGGAPVRFYCGARCVPVAHVVGMDHEAPPPPSPPPSAGQRSRTSSPTHTLTHFDQLDDHERAYLSKFLDVSDLVALSSTSKELRRQFIDWQMWRPKRMKFVPNTKRGTDALITSFMSAFGDVVKHADFENCHDVTDAGVRALAVAPRLARMNLAHCYLVTDAGVRALAAAPNLAIVNLDNCDMVTD
jgi:hypothetical protein